MSTKTVDSFLIHSLNFCEYYENEKYAIAAMHPIPSTTKEMDKQRKIVLKWRKKREKSYLYMVKCYKKIVIRVDKKTILIPDWLREAYELQKKIDKNK